MSSSPPELAKSQTQSRDGYEICVLQLIEAVVHTTKWVGILTCNLIKAAVVNAK
jgi:hypothetical protein